MKRICLYGAGENLGGTEVYIITLIRALKDHVKFDVLLHHNYGPIPFEEEIISYGGVIYREYYKNREKKLPEYISPKKLLSMHPEWDGIYLNLQSIDTSYRLLVEAKKKKMPYRIIHSHNISDFRKNSMKDRIYDMYFRITKRRIISDYFACSTLAGKSMFGNETKFHVIPNAVKFEKFQLNNEIRQQKRKEFQIHEDEIVIGFCGRLSNQKRPTFLIDIFSELKRKKEKCKLLIVGDGELKEMIRERAIRLDILKDILFVGSVNDTENYYQMMDCFVLPSMYEGFGIVLLEAQAAGLRCFTTSDVVPAETNITGRVQFLPINFKPEEWAELISDKGFDRCDCIALLNKSAYTIENMKNTLLNVFYVENNLR